MPNRPQPAPDDYARAVLLRIVPTGYRLIDDGDSRFAGIRQDFIRLAFKHLGPQPALVGFCAPGTERETTATPGQTLGILFRHLTDCPHPVDATLVSLVSCAESSDQTAAIGTYRALRPGTSELDLRPAGLGGHFAIVVR
jgi:hypothetical protein